MRRRVTVTQAIGISIQWLKRRGSQCEMWSGAGNMEANNCQVPTVFTVWPSFHHRHSTNQVSRNVTIVGERWGEVCDCTFVNDGITSWYSVCRVPMVGWRLDCDNCRHLTVVCLHDTGHRCDNRPGQTGTWWRSTSTCWHKWSTPVWWAAGPHAASLHSGGHLGPGSHLWPSVTPMIITVITSITHSGGHLGPGPHLWPSVTLVIITVLTSTITHSGGHLEPGSHLWPSVTPTITIVIQLTIPHRGSHLEPGSHL